MSANFCINCGEAFEAAVRFCSKCGQANETSGQVEEPSQVSQLVSIEVTSGKKTKGFKYVLVIVLIAIIGGGYFIISPSRSTIDANKMTASQIMNWLIENKYCAVEKINDFGDSFVNYQEIYKKDETRSCIQDNSKYIKNKNTYETDWSTALHIEILVNDGRYLAYVCCSIPADFNPAKSTNQVIGKNWTISFFTNEARYKGVFEEAKSAMLEISHKLTGRIASNYGPSDYCKYPLGKIDFNQGTSIESPANENEKRMYRDCKKYFPEYMDINRAFATWKD